MTSTVRNLRFLLPAFQNATRITGNSQRSCNYKRSLFFLKVINFRDSIDSLFPSIVHEMVLVKIPSTIMNSCSSNWCGVSSATTKLTVILPSVTRRLSFILKRSTSTSFVNLPASLFSFYWLKKCLLTTLLSAPVSNKASIVHFPSLIVTLGTADLDATLCI